MPQIVAVRTKDDSSRDMISVVLSQDAVCLGPDGQPWAGVALNPQHARSLAKRLVGLAMEIETGEQKPQEQKAPASLQSLTQTTSILVFHDGSGQGHRAFCLALDLARSSLASLHVAGIYGVLQDRFAPSTAAEDYEWRRTWLGRLFQMYSQDAAKAGIELQSTLVAANDETRLAGLFNSSQFDLLVLPRRFSDVTAVDDASRKLHKQFVGTPESRILLCP